MCREAHKSSDHTYYDDERHSNSRTSGVNEDNTRLQCCVVSCGYRTPTLWIWFMSCANSLIWVPHSSLSLLIFLNKIFASNWDARWIGLLPPPPSHPPPHTHTTTFTLSGMRGFVRNRYSILTSQHSMWHWYLQYPTGYSCIKTQSVAVACSVGFRHRLQGLQSNILDQSGVLWRNL